MLIGVDFDNTLVCYDDVFAREAQARGLVADGFQGGKRALRDAVRCAPGGELAWQRLQGYVYGSGIAGASLAAGADAFLRRCRREGRAVVIVSHRTLHGHHDPARVDLRAAAMRWLAERAFLSPHGYGLTADDVFWESTRADKLRRIASLGCTHYIDDLEEVLDDPSFPQGVRRMLFAPRASGHEPPDYPVCPTWQEIEHRLFELAG